MHRRKITGCILILLSLVATGCSHNDSNSINSTETVASVTGTGIADSSDTSDAQSILSKIDSYDYSSYIRLGQYTDFDVEVSSTEVTDSEVSAALDGLRWSSPKYVPTDKTECQSGDYVNVSYTISSDDAIMAEDESLIDTEFLLDEESSDKLNVAIIGMSVGETKDISIEYDVDETDTECDTTTNIYTVTLNSIDTAEQADVTDEWIASISDYDTVDAWKNYERDTLEKIKIAQQDDEYETSLIEKIQDACTFSELPQILVDDIISTYQEEDTAYAESEGITFTELVQSYYGYSDLSEYEAALRSYAEQIVKSNFMYRALRDTIGIEITDDEYTSFAENTAKTYGFDSVEDLYSYYDEETVKNACINEMILSKVKELNNKVITE